MFVGGSLKAKYYTSKINLMVALAPVSSTSSVTNKVILDAAKNWVHIKNTAELFKIYNMVGLNWW